jgi:hypothetical protein
MLNSSVRGRQASSIRPRTGVSWPERPGAEISCLRKGVNSIMKYPEYVVMGLLKASFR